MITAVKQGHSVGVGIEHEKYSYQTDEISPEILGSLKNDLN